MDDARRPEPAVGQDTTEGLVDPSMPVDDHRLAKPERGPAGPDEVLGRKPRGRHRDETTPSAPEDLADPVTDAARRLAPGQEFAVGEG